MWVPHLFILDPSLISDFLKSRHGSEVDRFTVHPLLYSCLPPAPRFVFG